MRDRSTIDNQTDKPGSAAGMLLYLTSVGLVSAAIITLFGIAAVSFLNTDRKGLKGSDLFNQTVTAKPMRSDVFSTRGDVAPVSIGTKLPSSAAQQTLPASPSPGAATEDTQPPEFSGAQPVSQPLSLGGDASPTKGSSLTGVVPTNQFLPNNRTGIDWNNQGPLSPPNAPSAASSP